jgi:hypothetical protein
MAIRKIPSAQLHPTLDTATKYEELLRRTEQQKALAREMITTARKASDSAIEMRKQAALTHSAPANFATTFDLPTQPTPPTPSEKGSVLNTWKEIANYLGRGVRTVQRYEADLDLPVRRFSGKMRTSVMALPQDLDAWLLRMTAGKDNPDANLLTAELNTAARDSQKKGTDLHLQNCALRDANNEALLRLTASLKAILKDIASSKVIPLTPPSQP